MFEPRYRLTPHLLKLIEQAAILTTKIAHTKISFSLKVRLEKEALDRSVHASTSIEGNELSLGQVAALNERREVAAEFKEKQEVINYTRAMQWIIKNSTAEINEAGLLRLHKIITDKLLDQEKSGAYKSIQNRVVNEKRVVVFVPPTPAQAPKMTKELLAWLKEQKDEHPVIVSALFHHQLVTIHPFADGNGRVARAAANWILYRSGFDPKHIYYLDEYFAKDRQRYYQKIQQARDLDHDLTYWIEYVAEGVQATLGTVFKRIQELSLKADEHLVVTPKQEELIGLIRKEGSIGSGDIGKHLKINRARVNQLIVPLIEAGIVKKEGKARATRYYLA